MSKVLGGWWFRHGVNTVFWFVVVVLLATLVGGMEYSLNKRENKCREAGGVPVRLYGGVVNCATTGYIDFNQDLNQ